MIKKSIALCLIAAMTLLVGCGDKNEFSELTSDAIQTKASSVAGQPEAVLYENPLTGVLELKEDELNQRPVAVMVNNISVAQSVQCGLNDADMVFECLVEGGISRLMAVYYDVDKAGQIGSVRSARYTYVQLSRWLDAVYVHCGSDAVYTVPYMRQIGMDDFDLGAHSGSCFRESNGLAWEHRLYTSGQKLSESLAQKGWRMTGKSEKTKPIFSFRKEDAPVTPDDACSAVTYAMSSSYKTTFTYDAATGKYMRKPGGSAHKDYKSGQATATDNLFILYADSPHFEDGYHLRTVLSSGEGLYVSKGGCQTIRWKKGDADDGLTLTDEKGKELTVNAGTSWFAFAPNSLKHQTAIES